MNTIASSRFHSGSSNIVVDKLWLTGYILGLIFVGWVVGLLLDGSPLGTHVGLLLTFGALVGLMRGPSNSNIHTAGTTLLDTFFLAIIVAALSLILLYVPFTSAGASAFASTYGGGMPFPLTSAIVTFVYTVAVWLYDCLWSAIPKSRD